MKHSVGEAVGEQTRSYIANLNANYNRLNVCVPHPQIHILKSYPAMWGDSGSWGLRNGIGSPGWSSHTWDQCSYKGPERASAPAPFPFVGMQRAVSGLQPRRGPWVHSKSASAFILDCTASRTMRNKCWSHLRLCVDFLGFCCRFWPYLRVLARCFSSQCSSAWVSWLFSHNPIKGIKNHLASP